MVFPSVSSGAINDQVCNFYGNGNIIDEEHQHHSVDYIVGDDGNYGYPVNVENEELAAPVHNGSNFSDECFQAAVDDAIILEHVLPSNIANRKRRRKTTLILASGLFLLGIIVVAAILVKSKSRNDDSVVLDGNDVGMAESGNLESSDNSTDDRDDNIFMSEGTSTVAYYVLEPEVQNATALLDMNAPEGKAFKRMVREEGISYNSSGGTACNENIVQRYAVLVLYYGVGGEAWTSTEGWGTTSDACDDWHGIQCNNSVITGIDLDRNNLHGNIPEDFCLLNDLETLVLSGNDVNLPACISRLSKLEKLSLQGNGYSGGLPSDFYSMPALAQLHLSDNQYNGTIDALFSGSSSIYSAFPSLTTLNLDNNQLSGDIPEGVLRRLPNLQSITLSGNPKLTGSLNEFCKGSALSYAEADCPISCRCCAGNNCPSSL